MIPVSGAYFEKEKHKLG